MTLCFIYTNVLNLQLHKATTVENRSRHNLDTGYLLIRRKFCHSAIAVSVEFVWCTNCYSFISLVAIILITAMSAAALQAHFEIC